MKTLVAVLFLIAFLDYISAQNLSSPGIFTVVCPKSLLSGRAIKCIATAEDLSDNQPLNLNITISDTKGTSAITKNISLDANTARLLKFSTESFPNGDYTLSVIGLDFAFVGEAKLSFLVKHFSVFIQTDKALYKADDLVRFRLFAVDANTLPYSVKASPVISIFNPSNVLVKKYANVSFVNGRCEDEFQLASSPVIGDWKIQMESEGQVFEKTFSVDEYTLPAFTATLSVPSSIPIADEKLLVTVGAQYTFGQSVQGTAVVSFKRNGYELAYQRTVAINGSSVTFEVDFQTDLLMIEDFYDQFVTVEVDFTDSLTGQLSTTSSDVKILQYEYQLTATGISTFSPGLQYTFSVTAVHYDGKPAMLGSSITITTAFDDASPVSQTLQIDDMSSAHLTVTVPLNTSVLQIVTNYKDATLNSYVYAPNTHQDQFLMVDITTTYPFIYEPVDISFEATEDVPSIIVIMLSKGIVVHSLKLNMTDGRASTQIIPKFSFAPETTIFAYYVRSNGEIVCGSSTLTLKSRLPNYLTLALTTTNVQPGDVASLEVMSTMNSSVSLLAIDQRSLLLKTGNDLSLNDIFSDLSSYNQPTVGRGWIGGVDLMPPWFFYRTYETDFSDSGLAIVSNAVNRIPLNPPWLVDAPILGIPQLPPIKTPIPEGSSQPRVRQNFAETFLWETVTMTQPNTRIPNRGMTTVEAVVPDSITSYLISGVSMNDKHGLAIATASPMLTVFQPFFIQMTLPFSVKRGEVLRQEILVFNYLNSAQSVTLFIVKNDVQFQVSDMAADGWDINDQIYFQTFTIESGSTKKAVVHLEALVIGFVDLSVSAIGSLAGDAVKLKLRVVPEGIESFIVSTTIVQHNATSNYGATLSCDLPNNVVSDTISISAKVVGSCIGNPLSNLDNLIQMPGGCGEQNMLNLVPDIVVLRYLQVTNQLTDDIETKATAFIAQGYQQELSYYRSDYSFSAFGDSDTAGSTWLTAFVLGAFNDAEEYIDVDQSIYTNSFGFLVSKQDAIGCFHEDGNVIHKDMQGGAASGVALTAYVSIVLTKCLVKFPWLQQYRDLAVTNIVTYYNQSDVYSLAVVSYALAVSGNENFSDVFDQFLSLSIQTPDELHWEKEVEVSWYPQSLDVEITAYGLLCALEKGDISLALRIVNWLVKQQNPSGGFQSTQDTVVGLTALAAFGSAFSTPAQNLTIAMTPQFGSKVIAGVNENNSLTPQTFDLAPNVRKLDLCSPVFGSGMAIVSLTCKFYVNDLSQAPRFKIDQDFENSCSGYLKMKICVSSIPGNDSWSPGMVLATIKYPTGYMHDVNSPVCTAFSKLDTANGGTEAQAYLNNVTEVPTCCYVNAIRAFDVEKLKGGSIEVVDYYDTSKKASLSYSLPALSDC